MATLEDSILSIGTPLVRRVQQLSLNQSALDKQRGQLFERCMEDPKFKAGLLGFLELYPALKTPELFASHLEEYLGNLSLGIVLGTGAALAGVAPALAMKAVQPIVEQTAKSFIVAEDMVGAAAVAKKMVEDHKGIYFTLDILGELTASPAGAARYQSACLDALDVLGTSFGDHSLDKFGGPSINLSTKVSALSAHFDPIDYNGTKKEVLAALIPIAHRAMSMGAFLNVDMEHFQYRSLVTDIFSELVQMPEFKNYPHFGTVVQAYLKDSEKTLDGLLKVASKRDVPFTLRLVKGAYWDSEVVVARQQGWPIPVWEEKWQSDAQYEKLTQKMMKNHGHIRTALGSHNLRSIVHGLALQRELNVAADQFEIQLLYGMGWPIAQAVEKEGVQVRLYGPVGNLVDGMGYFVRRILENTANGSFLRKMDANQNPAELLRTPGPVQGREIAQANQKKWYVQLGEFLHLRKPDVPIERKVEGIPAALWNHSQAPWHTAEARSSMEKALSVVEKRIGKGEYMDRPSVVGVKEVRSSDMLMSYNPSIDAVVGTKHSSNPIGSVSMCDHREINSALMSASKAFPDWSKRSVENRATIVEKMGKIMSSRQYELAALMCFEAGKPWREAHADVAEAIDFCTYYAREARELGDGRRSQRVPGERNITTYEARGPMSVIAPWNFPLAILAGMTTAALVTGNTVVMKPSPYTPLIASEFMQIAHEAGVPEGVLNYVVCRDSDAHFLVDSPLIHKVVFTGSMKVGTQIYETVAKRWPGQGHLRSAICEMGGKNAIIVDDTADLDAAVKGIVYSAFGFAGQKCSAASRVIVLSSVREEFLSLLEENIAGLRVGAATIPGIDVGPVIHGGAYAGITAAIKEAVAAGGKMIVSGQCTDKAGYYIAPTVIGIDSANPISRRELFGPVLAVMSADDFSSAIKVLNDTPFGLTAGLYSRTPTHHKRFSSEVQAGNLYINRGCTGALVERHPFGGFKMSGTGPKAGGPDYLRAFMHEKHVTTNTVLNGYVGE